jgi:hypothetical protein
MTNIQLAFQNYAISNSEVNCYQKCRRKHMYEFILRLTPKNQAVALSRGIIGHTALEIYYTELKNNSTAEYAEEQALAYIGNMIADLFSSGENIEMLVALRETLVMYFNSISGDDWEIIAVEQDFIKEYDGIPIGMRLDMLVKVRSGQWAGEILLVDHKFSYAKWSERDVQMNGQPYKYWQILKDNGIHVNRMVYNIIKYRSKSDIVERQSLIIKPVEAAVAIADHVTIAKEIQQTRNKVEQELADGDPQYRDKAPRVLDKYSCNMCSFTDICKAEMSGRTNATELMIQLDYKANDYGYQLSSEQ